MAVQKLPRVLSLRKAVKPRHGILYYSTVQSRSRSTRVNHVVTGAKIGRSVRFRCSCESASFHPQEKCIHVRAVVRRMVLRGAR